MAGGVSVEHAALQAGIGCCKVSIHELEQAARSLTTGYQQAGSGGWKDQKYAALGGIVEECCSALRQPISELEACMQSLENLLAAVDEYESTSI